MQFLNSPSTLGAKLPLSLAVRVGDALYISGMVGIIPDDRTSEYVGPSGSPTALTFSKLRPAKTGFNPCARADVAASLPV
jgi:enamine deaminase RidA (YjgF/YER057c/UK114 family)